MEQCCVYIILKQFSELSTECTELPFLCLGTFFSSGVSDYLVLLVWLFVIPMSNWSPVFSGRQHLEKCPLNLLTCSRLSCLLPILAQLASCSLYHLPESFYSYSRMFFFLDIRYHFTGAHPLDFWKRICFLFILHA